MFGFVLVTLWESGGLGKIGFVVQAALFELFAGGAGAGFVAADLGGGADERFAVGDLDIFGFVLFEGCWGAFLEFAGGAVSF